MWLVIGMFDQSICCSAHYQSIAYFQLQKHTLKKKNKKPHKINSLFAHRYTGFEQLFFLNTLFLIC